MANERRPPAGPPATTGSSENLPAEAGFSLGQLIKANHKAIASVLPKHVTPERMARLALAEARRNPQLLEADAGTFIGALIQASSLGLEPGPAGLGYLIPRFNKHTRLLEVQFQAGYKGLMKLARNSGEVGSIMAEVVCEGDLFEYMLGTNPFLKHKPALSGRGPVTHVYAVAHLHNSDDWQFTVMTTDEVEKVRDRAKATGFSPWQTDWEEMAKKTVLRRLMKYMPFSAEVMGAIGAEEAAEAGAGPGSVAFVPEGMDMSAGKKQARGGGLASKMAGVDEAEYEEVPQEQDDWSLMDGPQLYSALQDRADTRVRWKRALADLSARNDVDGMRKLAREMFGAGEETL